MKFEVIADSKYRPPSVGPMTVVFMIGQARLGDSLNQSNQSINPKAGKPKNATRCFGRAHMLLLRFLQLSYLLSGTSRRIVFIPIIIIITNNP